ncbi:MAG: rhodanese-like domain-containing protein [Thermoplasmata archaeon]|nr:rhodanese-like domain-containing protein [Thermoplasmata archaeon]
MQQLIVDVRTREEFVKEHIKGAICIPHYDLKYYLDFLAGKNILLYCNTERRSAIAQNRLAEFGLDSRVLDLKEQDGYERVQGSIICAQNYVHIKPGHEDMFMEKAMLLCRVTEHMDGFLGSKALKISGMSGIGSCMETDLTELEIRPTKMILVTYWESKEAHERSHRDPEFKAVFDKLGEHLVRMPVEEFYEILK